MWLPATLLSLALLFAVIFIGLVTVTETGSASGILFEAPSSNIVTLKAGTPYGIAMESSDASSADREPPTIDITAPNGAPVAPGEPGIYLDPTLTYLSVIRPPVNGDFSVVIGDAPDGEPMQIVLVERPGGDNDALGTMLILLSGMLFLAGGGLLIMRLVVRKRSSL